jgi:prepilin peptidase CpaA
MPFAIQFVLAGAVFVAAVYDIRFRRIPNWLVLAALLLGLALNGFLFGGGGLLTSLKGIGLAFVIYFPLYLLRGMGAGDVKLMMAIGSLVGPGPWFIIFLCTGLLGGILALAFLLLRRRFRHTLWNVGFLVTRLARFEAPYAGNPELDLRTDKGLRLPHGAVIALATVAMISLTRIFPSL